MKLFPALAVSFFFLGSWAQAEDPASIVEKADAIRNPAESYRMEVEVVSSDRPEEPSRFEVSLMGSTRTLIVTLAPGRDKGRKLLMVDQDMWAYLPSVSRPVRVSMGQKLTGQTANGDLSRMRWAGDYQAVVEKEDATTWTLLLTATRKGLTYDKIRAQIAKKTYRPVTAEFLSLSGKTLKHARYGGWKTMAGAERPTEIELRDALRVGDYSRLKILSMQPRSFSAAQFNPQGMR